MNEQFGLLAVVLPASPCNYAVVTASVDPFIEIWVAVRVGIGLPSCTPMQFELFQYAFGCGIGLNVVDLPPQSVLGPSHFAELIFWALQAVWDYYRMDQ